MNDRGKTNVRSLTESEIVEPELASFDSQQTVRSVSNSNRIQDLPYRTIVESVNSIILRWDVAGRILFLNQYGQKFFGFSEDEILGQSAFNTILPKTSTSGQDLEAMILDIVHYPERYEFNENENCCKNGDRVWVAWTNKPIFDNQGQLVEILSVGTDITAHKQTVDQLCQREAELQEVQRIAKVGSWQFDLASGKITWSEEIFRIFGRDPQHPPLSYDEHKQSIHPDYRELHRLIDQQVLQTGQSQSLEFRFSRMDGSIGWLWTRIQAIFSPSGQVIGLKGVAIDISDRKEAEIALQISEKRFSSIANAAPVGIFRTDNQGNCLYVNKRWCQITGLSYERALGQGWSQALHPDDCEHVAREWNKATQENRHFKVEYRFLRADGCVMWVDGEALAERDDNGEIIGYIGTITDITERRKALDQRQQAEAELTCLNAELEQRVLERTQALQHSEERLQEVNDRLKNKLNELQQRNAEMLLLSGLNDYLQSALTVKEACSAISALSRPLFPDCSGVIYILDLTTNQLERLTFWGKSLHSDLLFLPLDCWALRRGRIHWVGREEHDLFCNHIDCQHPPEESLCIPMMAQGETLGLLYICTSKSDIFTESRQQLARTVAEQLSLAIANIKLRDKLHHQSIRDPLTTLFNRRYLEEFLEQELARAKRNHYSVGVIMLDIDHFKQFNDRLGHEAGDLILKKIAHLLREDIRASDIACRYGGEEMTLILQEASIEETYTKAEQLRIAIAALSLDYDGQSVGFLTASFGVACFPEQGLTLQTVIQAADTALFCAKKAGRNRVIMADNSSNTLH